MFTCPLTNVNFRGGCPIIPCHANITNYKPERSCCLHIEARKSEFDKWDLQQYLGIKEAKLYKYREAGENKVTSVVLLSKLISHLRENCQTEKPTKNLSDFANFINKSNLGLHEINPHLSDVLLIKNNLDKVYEFLKNSGQQDLPLAELLGTNEPFPE